MKRLLIFTLLTAFAGAASALMPVAPLSDCDPGLLHKSSFLNVEKLGALFAPAKASVFMGHCSGSFISDQGHVLTASHCLEGCLKDTTWKSEDVPKDGLSCMLTINGKKVKARVVLASKCSVNKMLAATGKGDVSCPDQADLAVLMPDPPPENFECLNLASGTPRVGADVMGMGYPMPTQRPGSHHQNSDGQGLQVTPGRVTNSETCVSVDKNGTATEQKIYGAKYFNQRHLQTTADANVRQSGGPLLNDDNEVIGVAMMFVLNAQDAKRECPGAAYFEPLRQLKTMAAQWGNQKEISSMKCSAKRVKSPAAR